MQRFFSELQRRKVLRIASGYVVGGWIILQVALALQTAMSLPVWFSTVIVSLLIIGFPIALVATWFLEITPEGIKRTVASGDGTPIKPQTPDFILAGMLALVVIVAIAQLALPRDSTPTTTTAEAPKLKPKPPALGDKSIAVLPFANLSPDKENEYFADGLTEELLNLLAKIGDLKVISRTSSFAFKGKDTPLPEIAKQLGVRHILEGSVRTDGGELRVTAQLIDVSTDTHLWSETYERKLENVFALQDEIARDIAGALNVEVTIADGTQEAPTKDFEAYRMFLKARALHARRSKGDLQEGVGLYKRAIALDPNFAEAHAGLATNYTAMAAASGAEPFAELRALARLSAVTALKLKPTLARAYGVIGTLARQEFDWQAAVDNYSKAIALDPSDSVALVSLSTALFMIGDFEQARRLRDGAGRIDPIYNFLVARLLIFDDLARHDDEAAKKRATKLTQSEGDMRGLGFAVLSLLAREKGDIVEAERTYRASVDANGVSGAFVESVIHSLKSRKAFGETAKRLHDQAALNPAFDPEVTFFLIGDHDGFFDALDARIARGDTARFLTFMSMAWRLTSAGERANQRFKTLARKIGLVDYWKKHGWPDRCRAKGEDDFECS